MCGILVAARHHYRTDAAAPAAFQKLIPILEKANGQRGTAHFHVQIKRVIYNYFAMKYKGLTRKAVCEFISLRPQQQQRVNRPLCPARLMPHVLLQQLTATMYR